MTSKISLPVFINASANRILIVGGGKLASEQLNDLMQNIPDANISVLAKRLSDDIKNLLLENTSVKIINDDFKEDYLELANLFIVATENSEQDQIIINKLKEHKNLYYAPNFPSQSDFFFESDSDKQDEKQLFPINNEKKWRRIATFFFLAFVVLLIVNILSFYIGFKDLEVAYHYLNYNTDERFFWLFLVGFVAQLIDGALGMGYGVTCTAALLYIGIPLPAISSSIHTAEMFSSGASGFSHYKFGNINKKLFKNILIPGVIGAVLGALLLAYFGEKYAGIIKPILATYTFILGIRILFNAFKKNKKRKKTKRVGWLAGAGGFLDSFGGGGWGPLVTSTLISKGKTPRYIIGTVSLTEFFVTFASALTFFSVIGISHWQLIAALILGGVLAAPIAAKLAGKLPLKVMFIGVGSMVIIWSLNVLLKAIHIL
ncbi:TSUP family transporter [Epilithonimonas sp.]|uniref:TSUP family transporter n=1 Tax=Epilithonimonas sp. TaxID=2894511 RepID=UPI00289E3DE2|nr:TSUP family transporter [Epilithonimonas sp.]